MIEQLEEAGISLSTSRMHTALCTKTFSVEDQRSIQHWLKQAQILIELHQWRTTSAPSLLRMLMAATSILHIDRGIYSGDYHLKCFSFQLSRLVWKKMSNNLLKYFVLHHSGCTPPAPQALSVVYVYRWLVNIRRLSCTADKRIVCYDTAHFPDW